jgi:energy-converting hydrogenase Eha subunit C
MIAVTASAICGLMLPIAYIGIFWLNNSKAYLQENTPRGVRAVVWNVLMLIAITVSVIGAIYYILTKYFK